MFILERLLSLIAPHECLVCGREGSLLCVVCQLDACPPLPERCYKCHVLSQNSKVCLKCRRKSRLSNVWVRTSYEAVAKDLVHGLKFERAQSAARPIAQLTCEVLPYLKPEVIVAFIPTATTRHRQRGYDQARLLAREIAGLQKLHCIPLLGRIGQSRQVGAKRAQRTHQLEGAYYVKAPLLVKNKDILVVDDITTTGSTLEAAASILKAAGARRVYGVVFAQKQ